MFSEVFFNYINITFECYEMKLEVSAFVGSQYKFIVVEIVDILGELSFKVELSFEGDIFMFEILWY